MTLFMILRALSIQYMLSLLQGIFPTQGSDPGLLNCRLILYQLNHQGGPRNTAWHIFPIPRTLAHHTPMFMGFPRQEYWWVALSLSRGSSQPSD